MAEKIMLLETISKLPKEKQNYMAGYTQAVLDMYPPKEKKKRKKRK